MFQHLFRLQEGLLFSLAPIEVFLGSKTRQLVEGGQDVRSLRPKISVKIYHPEELLDLLNTGRRLHSLHGVKFLRLRPNALTGKEITKIFHFFLHEEEGYDHQELNL